jgi:hypothetical protein
MYLDISGCIPDTSGYIPDVYLDTSGYIYIRINLDLSGIPRLEGRKPWKGPERQKNFWKFGKAAGGGSLH